MSTPKTLYDKIWNDHLVSENEDGTSIIYIDRHLVHEVTSPQAFEGLKIANRSVRKPNFTLATADHNIPTTNRDEGISDPESKLQVDTLEENCKEHGITFLSMSDKRQGIVHIIGPEQGFTQPGMTIVCGDSHTSTHGAFGALAWGIGTSEVEHVLATQTLVQTKAKNMQINIQGELPLGVTAKDIVLKIIQTIGTAGGTGYVIEYTGDAIKSLTMEGRMTVCNMSIEAGARAGLISPDEKTIEYLNQIKDNQNPFFCFVPFNGPYGHWPSIKGKSTNKFASLYEQCELSTVPREGINKRVLKRYSSRLLDSGED